MVKADGIDKDGIKFSFTCHCGNIEKSNIPISLFESSSKNPHNKVYFIDSTICSKCKERIEIKAEVVYNPRE